MSLLRQHERGILGVASRTEKNTYYIGHLGPKSLLIARACNVDIYILNISSVDHSSLGELFIKLPTHCVILLKYINAVDATQSR
jgi:hypothetical protein